jgi:hypothetical protein
MDAFAPYLTKRASLTKRVLREAVRFGKMDSPEAGSLRDRSIIVIDADSLLRGLVSDGIQQAEPRTSSLWTVEWLRAREIDPESVLANGAGDLETTLSGHTIVEPSRILREKVFPAAQEYSRLMTGSADIHLRHLTFALLNQAAVDGLAPPFTSELLDGLRRDFLSRVLELYPKEQEFWEGIAIEAETDQMAAVTPIPREAVAVLSDAATTKDRLGRKVFAEILATRLCEASANASQTSDGSDAAFVVHMEGPWGSGKSTLLKLLKHELEILKPAWLVVEFNAWRNQHRKPSWFPLILAVRSAAVRRLSIWSPLVWSVWLLWRIRMDWLTYLIALSLISLTAFLVWGSGTDAATGWARQFLGLTKSTGEAIQSAVTVIAAVGSLIAMARGLALGSQRHAEVYLALKTEPFRRIIRLFERLVWATHRPIAVFVDDLDRCESDSVIELIESIQTSLRGAPIVYVIAGDRRWISSSFKKKYQDFDQAIGSPGRPLSHLFLHKVFQLSVSVPRLSPLTKKRFLRYLLGESDEDQQERLEVEAMSALSGKTSHEELQRAISRTEEGTAERETIQAAAAKQVTSPKATARTEHRLRAYDDMIESNPRAMKLLVNALAISQASAFLEGRQVPFDTLVRWTILETRWPLLAEFVLSNWPDVDLLASPGKEVPPDMGTLLGSAAVRTVVGSKRESQLSKDKLKLLLD